MKTFTKMLLGGALLAGTLSANASTFVGGRTDFRDETIYFCMTSRFYDGDSSNNTYCWDGVNNINDPEWRGDFKGLIQKLDYLKALGFTAVWITPVVENCSGLDYHGYHAMNFSKVDPRNESTDCKFQDLIDAAHARGMKIVLDIVLQHTGNFGEENLCPMFEKDYTANQSNIYKSLKLHPKSKLPANYNSLQPGAQYSARLSLMKNVDGQNHDTRNFWHHYAHFNWDNASRWWGQIAGDCVDLNTENPAVTNYVVSCYSKFIEMGVDAFRIDTSGHISRLAFNKAFIPQFTEAGEKFKAKRGGTPFYMFGEVCARAEEVIYRNGDYNTSPCWYTWKEDKDYAWDYSETSWDNFVVMEGDKGGHTNALSVIQQETDYAGQSNMSKSNNAWLDGNAYHTPDYSKSSGFNVIDFPMHWRFHRASNAFGVHTQDDLYNDATWNVVYVDSHDYGPNGWDTKSFGGGTAAWAENLSLMFTFRGIPCIYHGTETEFRKGNIIDKGTIEPLFNTSRAYYGGYMKGSVTVTDFAEYSNATGNMKASLAHPLARHIQRLNKIRAAVPALRKGQYSVSGCSGSMAFKRRYTDSSVDSYCLVTVSGNATFTGVENGTYVDCVTGDKQTVTDGNLTVTCSGQGNLRVYVLNTAKTPAPGKIGEDGQYLYGTAPVSQPTYEYDGTQEEMDTTTVRDTESGGGGGGGSTEEPEEPIEPSRTEDEVCAFFENTASWGGTISAWVWDDSNNYTGGSWPGQACTYLGNKIWKWSYTGSDDASKATKIIFSAGSKTDDLDFVNGGYYDADGYVKTIAVGAATEPNVTITPNGGSFTGTQSVTIKANSVVTSAWYKIGNGSQVSFTGSATFTIGADMAEGESVIVSWSATGADKTVTGSATFIKNKQSVDPEPEPNEFVVYWDNSNTSSWSNLHCYFWGGTSSVDWPGAVVTEQIATGIYKYVIAEGSTGLIFNNGDGGSNQTVDITPEKGHVYTGNGNDGGKVGVKDLGLYTPSAISTVAGDLDNGIEVSVVNGVLCIQASQAGFVTISDVAGRAQTVAVFPGYNFVENLQGFYIVNGKKLFINR